MSAADRLKPSPVQLVFDTNILVDALLSRGPYHSYAMQLLEKVRRCEVEGWYAPHSITTVYYLVEKTLAPETANRKETVGPIGGCHHFPHQSHHAGGHLRPVREHDPESGKPFIKKSGQNRKRP